MRRLPHTRSCFVCGESNPIGMRLQLETDGQIVQARYMPAPEHIGFKQTVHGGLVSTLLDEIMAWACAVQARHFSYCAELNVRFLRPLRPGIEVIARGEVINNRRGKLFEAKAEVVDLAGTVLATSTGKYIPVKETDAAVMATDLVGDPSSVTGAC